MSDIQFTIAAIDNFTSTFRNLDSQLSQAYSAAGSFGKGMMIAGSATAAGLGFAVNTAAEFEAAMDKVGALAGATGKQFDQLRDTALDLGASTSKSASEVAMAMQDLAAKGFDVNSVMSAMPGIIAASEASGEDLALTSGVVASALNAWQMEASEATKVADVLAMAANMSAAGVEDMGYAFKYAAPVANTLGIGMNELAAATGIMTNSGLAGEQAGTALRMSLLRLVDAPNEAAKAMDKMGFTALDANGDMKSLSQIIGDLNSSLDGMTDAQKAAELATIFGAEAVTGMLAILNGGQAQFDKFVDSLNNSGGSAAATAAIMRDNLIGAIEEMGGAFETAQIAIGSALIPAIRSAADMLTVFINKFNALSPGVQTALTVIAAVSAVLMILGGGVLWFVSLIPGFIGGVTAIAGALNMTAGAFAVTIGWIALAIVAVAGIGLALYKAYQNIGWFRDMVNAAWAQIKTYWGIAIEWIKAKTSQVIGVVSSFIGQQLEKIRSWWKSHGDQVMSIVRTLMQMTSDIVKAGMRYIQGIFQIVFPILEGIVRVAWSFISNYIDTAIDVILGIIDVGMSLLEGDWSGAWESIKGIVVDIVEGIIGFFQDIDLFEVGKDIIQGLVNGISNMAGSVGDAVAAIAKGIPAGVKKLLGIHSPSRIMMALGEFTGEGFAIGVGDMQKMVSQASAKLANAALIDGGSVGAMSVAPIRRTSGTAAAAAASTSDSKLDLLVAAIREQVGRRDPIEVVVNMDGRTVARQLVDPMDAELKRKATDKGRAAGRR